MLNTLGGLMESLYRVILDGLSQYQALLVGQPFFPLVNIHPLFVAFIMSLPGPDIDILLSGLVCFMFHPIS